MLQANDVILYGFDHPTAHRWQPRALTTSFCRLSRNAWDGSKTDSLILVHEAGYDEYKKLAVAHRLEHGCFPYAILVVEKDSNIPADAFRYVDLALRGYSRKMITDLVTCPMIVTIPAYVGSLPDKILGLLAETGINPADLPVELLPVQLDEQVQLLRDSEVYRRHFAKQLNVVLRTKRHKLDVLAKDRLGYELDQQRKGVANEAMEQFGDLLGSVLSGLGGRRRDPRSRSNGSGDNGPCGFCGGPHPTPAGAEAIMDSLIDEDDDLDFPDMLGGLGRSGDSPFGRGSRR